MTHAITMTIDITIFDATKREFNPPLLHLVNFKKSWYTVY